jgi:hypothetical protein
VQPLTGRALRDRTIRDYRRAAERAGQSVDARAIESLAIHDCEVYDAVTRAARPSAPAKPDPELEAKREAALDEMAAEVGVEIDRGGVSYKRAPISRLHTSHVPTSRAAYATARIQRIISGATADRNPRRGHVDVRDPANSPSRSIACSHRSRPEVASRDPATKPTRTTGVATPTCRA